MYLGSLSKEGMQNVASYRDTSELSTGVVGCRPLARSERHRRETLTAARDDDRAAALFCSVISVSLAVQFVSARSTIGAPRPLLAALVLGMCLLLLNGPVAWTRLRPSVKWYRSTSSLTLFGLLGLCVIGYFPWANFLGYPTAVAGVIAFGWNVSRFPVGIRGWPWRLLAVAIAVALGVLCGRMAWGYGYQNPFLEETLLVPVGSNGLVDTYYHAATSSMLRTYGVASTGLDGIPFTPYHFGSHFILGQLADVLGINSLEMYGAGYPIIFIPFVIFSMLLLAISVRAMRDWDSRCVVAGGLFVLLLGFGRFLPHAAMDALGLWPEDLIISESFLFGVAMSCLTLGMIIPVFRDLLVPGSALPRSALVAIPLLIALCGWCKISVALPLVGLLWYCTLRLRLSRPAVLLSALAATVLVFVVMRTGAAAQRDELGLHPLYFLETYVQRAWWPYFFLTHFFWSWIAVLLRIRQEGVRGLDDLWGALRSRRLLDVEALLVICVAGLVPCMLLPIAGGSGAYFIQLQWWLALSLILSAWRSPAKWMATSVSAIAIGLFALITAWQLAAYVPRLGKSIRKLEREVKAAVASGARQSLFDALHQIEELPRSVKRRSLLYIPSSNDEYWRLGSHGIIPFAAPALTGMAMLDGIPSFEDIDRRYRGFPSYIPHEQLSKDPCQRAVALGFHQLFVIEPNGAAQVVRQQSCP